MNIRQILKDQAHARKWRAEVEVMVKAEYGKGDVNCYYVTTKGIHGMISLTEYRTMPFAMSRVKIRAIFAELGVISFAICFPQDRYYNVYYETAYYQEVRQYIITRDGLRLRNKWEVTVTEDADRRHIINIPVLNLLYTFASLN